MAEQPEIVALVGAIGAALGAAGSKLLDVYLTAHRSREATQAHRDDFIATLLIQERERYDRHLEEYKAADREERHSLRNRVAVLEGETELLRRKLDDAREENDVRREQIAQLTEELRVLKTWQRTNHE